MTQTAGANLALWRYTATVQTPSWGTEPSGRRKRAKSEFQPCILGTHPQLPSTRKTALHAVSLAQRRNYAASRSCSTLSIQEQYHFVGHLDDFILIVSDKECCNPESPLQAGNKSTHFRP